MARERQVITIDGVEYSTTPISPIQGSLIFFKLLKVFGPAIGKMFTGGQPPDVKKLEGVATDFKDMPIDTIFEVVSNRLDENEIVKIAYTLLSQTYPVSRGPQKLLNNEAMFNLHFGDENLGMLHMFKVVKEVLQIQYADFFEELGILGDKPEDTQSIESPMVP